MRLSQNQILVERYPMNKLLQSLKAWLNEDAPALNVVFWTMFAACVTAAVCVMVIYG